MRILRVTHAGFRDLAVWMIGFGGVAGLLLPLFMLLVGVPRSSILTLSSFGSSVSAGIAVGALSFTLARLVVGARVRELSGRMSKIADLVRERRRRSRERYSELST